MLVIRLRHTISAFKPDTSLIQEASMLRILLSTKPNTFNLPRPLKALGSIVSTPHPVMFNSSSDSESLVNEAIRIVLRFDATISNPTAPNGNTDTCLIYIIFPFNVCLKKGLLDVPSKLNVCVYRCDYLIIKGNNYLRVNIIACPRGLNLTVGYAYYNFDWIHLTILSFQKNEILRVESTFYQNKKIHAQNSLNE